MKRKAVMLIIILITNIAYAISPYGTDTGRRLVCPPVETAELMGTPEAIYEMENGQLYAECSYFVQTGENRWESVLIVRRARFSDAGSFLTEHGMGRVFQCHRWQCNLFLQYDVVVEGERQGDFKNYQPEPLREILSSNSNVQFGVELVTVVSGSRNEYADEGEGGAERRVIIPLNASSARYGEENYRNSRWVSMTSGKAPPVQVPEDTRIETTPPPDIQRREDEEIDRSDWDIF